MEFGVKTELKVRKTHRFLTLLLIPGGIFSLNFWKSLFE